MKNYTGYDTKEEYEASVKEYLEQSYEEQSTYDEAEDLISACLARTESQNQQDSRHSSQHTHSHNSRIPLLLPQYYWLRQNTLLTS